MPPSAVLSSYVLCPMSYVLCRRQPSRFNWLPTTNKSQDSCTPKRSDRANVSGGLMCGQIMDVDVDVDADAEALDAISNSPRTALNAPANQGAPRGVVLARLSRGESRFRSGRLNPSPSLSRGRRSGGLIVAILNPNWKGGRESCSRSPHQLGGGDVDVDGKPVCGAISLFVCLRSRPAFGNLCRASL